MKTSTPTVLILGATGMLGGVAYSYLSGSHKNVFGTSRRKNSKFLLLNARDSIIILRKTFAKIKPDYLVNCIGILKDDNRKDLLPINSDFPKTLTEISKDRHFKIINISTDAVFGNMQGEVSESSIPKPEDEYGKSKLNGEQKITLNIRTSILGLDPSHHKGLLEHLLLNGKNINTGYVNQSWSGATTLQLAKFIEDLIYNRKFTDLFKRTNVVHFSPINSVNKYNIVEAFSSLLKLKKPKEGLGNEINRILSSKFISKKELKHYCNSPEKSLSELLKFHKDYVKTYEKN